LSVSSLSNGTYYIHIGSEDTLNRDLCPGREYSNILKLDVPGGSTNAGIGGPGCVPSISSGDPGGSGGHGGDNTPPQLSLSYKRKQHVTGVTITAKTDEPATVTGDGVVALPGTRKRFPMITVTNQVAANAPTKVRLKLNKRDLKAAKKALRHGRRLKARVTISAIDPFFNSYVARRTIKLKL
jgi:hypothetical protein